jgi:predicted nuclease of predicted toxin-antitoxin system
LTLLFDENFPPYLPKALRLFGVEAQHCKEQGLEGEDDTVIFQFLRQRGWIWVTHDKGVKRKKHEREAFIQAGIGAFVYTGSVQRSAKEMMVFTLQIVDELESIILSTRPPFVYAITDRKKFERLR